MRSSIWPLTVVLGLSLALSGCPSAEDASEDDSVEDLTIVVEADKSRILQEEESLEEKRATVEEQADRLAKDRKDLQSRLASLSKKDKKQRAKLEADAKRLEAEEKKARDKMRSVESERAKLEREKTELLERISNMAGGRGAGNAETAQLRNDVRSLSRKVDGLQAEVDKLSKDSETRHEELLAALRAGGATRTVMVSAPAAPARQNLTRAQVAKLQRQVKSRMESKGILNADLPPMARDLEKNGKSAMSAKDYSGAHESFSQLGAIVDGIKVDHAFVQAKFARINNAYNDKVSKLDGKKRQRVLALLDDVSDSFSDGRFDRANRKINQIHSLLGGH
jgi:chromosome segregation ATPase